MLLTPKIEKAIVRAAELHRHQKRKAGGAPYIVHPYAVAFLLAHYSDDEDLICAALLHDILEDVPQYGATRMQEEFGERVYAIVREVSEDHDPVEGWRLFARKRSWKLRKEGYLENLKNDSREALLIACADKIHNIRSLVQSYTEHGRDVWRSFPAGQEETLWFYRSVLAILRERLNHSLVTELAETLSEAESKMAL